MTGSADSASVAAPARARVPDFFVVGHPKCGTSALYLMLRAHPQIFMPVPKEPRFFAPELWSRFRRPGENRLPDTLEGYLALFSPAREDQLVGEASPTYLRSREAAARIAEVAPDARMIAILREPAAFLRSFHQQSLHDHIEYESDFAKAIALEPQRREGKRIPRYSHLPAGLLYSEHVRYVEQLRRFHDRFPAERVLVLIHEDFRQDNEGTVRRVLRFLGVDADIPLPVVGDRDAAARPLQASARGEPPARTGAAQPGRVRAAVARARRAGPRARPWREAEGAMAPRGPDRAAAARRAGDARSAPALCARGAGACRVPRTR